MGLCEKQAAPKGPSSPLDIHGYFFQKFVKGMGMRVVTGLFAGAGRIYTRGAAASPGAEEECGQANGVGRPDERLLQVQRPVLAQRSRQVGGAASHQWRGELGTRQPGTPQYNISLVKDIRKIDLKGNESLLSIVLAIWLP